MILSAMNVDVPEKPQSPRSRTLKVLHVYRTYFPDTQGGLEETIRQICYNAQSIDIESTVLTTSPNPDPATLDLSECRVVRVKKNLEIASCSIAWGAFAEFRKLLETTDIVHYHFPWPFVDLLHLGVRPTVPTIVTYHSDIVRQRILGLVYAPVMNQFLKSVDRIVCTSPNYFATSNVLTKFENKVDVIPIGLNPDTYPTVDENEVESARQEFGENFFLFVGVLRYYKGLHILLDAIKGADFKVVIAGSGPTEHELKAHAASLGLDNVTFTGHVSDATKVALTSLSCGIVFPSYLRSEAFGITLLEGAMYGKPLISTEVGSGTSHINKHGETGIVVPPGSPKALRKAMDQIYNNPDHASHMGRRARHRFEQLFTGERMASQYAELYRELAGHSADPAARHGQTDWQEQTEERSDQRR